MDPYEVRPVVLDPITLAPLIGIPAVAVMAFRGIAIDFTAGVRVAKFVVARQGTPRGADETRVFWRLELGGGEAGSELEAEGIVCVFEVVAFEHSRFDLAVLPPI